jgi:hypothetical protein
LSYIKTDNHQQVIELRFEMDCLVFLSNTPHGLDASHIYQPADLELKLFKADLWLNKTFAAIPARKINADFKTMHVICSFSIRENFDMTALAKLENTVLSEICPAGEAWMGEVKKAVFSYCGLGRQSSGGYLVY